MAAAAGLIAALGGQPILSSIVVMSDAPGLFWATASAFALIGWERSAVGARTYWIWLPAASVALALANATRWIYGGLLLPFGAFAILVGYRKLRGVRTQSTPSARPPRSAEYFSFALATLAFSSILAFQLYLNALSPGPVLHHGWLVNWDLLGAWRTSFDNPDGHFSYRLPPVIFYAAPLIHPLYLSPLLTSFVLFGAWTLRRSAALIILGGWIVTLYLYLIGVPYENGRFALAFLPPAAVLASIGLFRVPWPPPAFGWLRWLLLAVSLTITMAFTYRSLLKLDLDKRHQTAAIRYLQSRVPPGSTVVTFGLSISLAHYTPLTVIDLFMQTPQSLRPMVCGNRTVHLFIDRDNIDSQWSGHSPATNFHWLRDLIGLQQIGTERNWVLYRVRSCSL
jgi:hypothetical protein